MADIKINIGANDTASAVLANVASNVAKFSAKTGESLKSIGSSVSRIGTSVAAAGASIAGPLAAAVKSFGDAGDVLDKMSKRTGVAVESLSELAFAAEQSGSSIESVEKGIRGMQRSLLNAELGSKEVTDSLAALGFTAEDLQGKLPEDQFTLLADALAGIDDPSKKAALSLKLFGRAGSELLPLFNESSKGIANLRQEARDLGRQMTTEDAQAAAAFTDAWNRVKSTLVGVKNQIGAALAPTITALANRAAAVITNVVAWIQNNRKLIQILAMVGTAVTVLGTFVTAMGGTIFAAGVAFSGMATAASAAAAVITAAFTPIGAIIAAVVVPIAFLGGLFLVAAYRTGMLGKMVEQVGKVLRIFGVIARQVFGGISQAIQDGDWEKAVKIGMAGARVAFFAGLEAMYNGFVEMWPTMYDTAKEFFSMLANLAWKTMSTVAKAIATGGTSGAKLLANLATSSLFSEGFSVSSGAGEFLADKRRSAQQDLDRLTGGGTTRDDSKKQLNLSEKMLSELQKLNQGKPTQSTLEIVKVGP